MKKTTKLLLVMLSLCLLAVLFSTAALADSEAYAVYNSGNQSLTFVVGELQGDGVHRAADGSVYTGDEYYTGFLTDSYCRGGTTWYSNQASITEVTFLDTIAPTSTAYWFCDFYNLTVINNIANLNTSNVTDMEMMFYYCYSLTSLDVSHLDTHNVTNMSNMFTNCTGLTALDVGSWDTGNVTNMCNMFDSCSSLTSLDVGSWNTGNVTWMNNMFWFCSSLTSLNVGNWNTGNVTGMRTMFRNCSSLTSLNVSNWNTGNVTDMYGIFEGCSSLTSLDVSNWNTGNVTDMSYMFAWCRSSLTSLDVSNWNTGNVTDMQSMFNGCSVLTSLDVSNWNTGNVTNMASMFACCSDLTSLDVSSWNTANVTNMDDMFRECSSLTSLTFNNWGTGNVTDMNGMFSNCFELVSLDLSSWNTGNVTKMNNMFAGCSSLTTLDVSSWNTGNVTRMDGMFWGCSSLTTLDVSNWDTGNVTDMYGMFDGCSTLSTLVLGENFSFVSGTDCNLPSGNWINQNNGSKKTSQQLMINYDGATMAGTWVREIPGPTRSLAAATVTGAEQTYSGEALTTTLTVILDGVSLNEGEDFEVTGYENNVNAGTATVTISGINNYEGTVSGTFTIRAKSLSDADVDTVDQDYTGGEVTSPLTVTVDGKPLTEGVDFTVEYEDNVEAGTATVTITGIGNYEGEAFGSFEIKKSDSFSILEWIKNLFKKLIELFKSFC